MSIYLIRHGATAANERHLYCGSTDLPLSERGVAQLREKRYTIANAGYVTSGMKRANETLCILFGEVDYKTDARFREVDFGRFEMRSYEELKDDPEYQLWITGDNDSNVPPGGESGAQMKARVLEAFGELEDGTVLVTHGGVIAAIMESLFPEEGKNRYQWQPKNGCGYVLEDGGYRPLD